MEREDHDCERVRDIVERLTAEDILTSIITSVWCKVGRHPGELADLTKEAADEITRLRVENKKLREALKPFASANLKPYEDAHRKYVADDIWFEVGDLRAAAAAIRGSGDE